MEYQYEEIKDDEILGENVFFEDEEFAEKYDKVSNPRYCDLTVKQAKAKSAQFGRKCKFYRRINQSLKAHQEMVERAGVQFTDSVENIPGEPFHNNHNNLLKDKFTINKEKVDGFKGTFGHPIGVYELLPILQQIMNNQKEIMDAINARPEDKIVKEKFLEEFDKKMQEVIKN